MDDKTVEAYIPITEIVVLVEDLQKEFGLDEQTMLINLDKMIMEKLNWFNFEKHLGLKHVIVWYTLRGNLIHFQVPVLEDIISRVLDKRFRIIGTNVVEYDGVLHNSWKNEY